MRGVAARILASLSSPLAYMRKDAIQRDWQIVPQFQIIGGPSRISCSKRGTKAQRYDRC